MRSLWLLLKKFREKQKQKKKKIAVIIWKKVCVKEQTKNIFNRSEFNLLLSQNLTPNTEKKNEFINFVFKKIDLNE